MIRYIIKNSRKNIAAATSTNPTSLTVRKNTKNSFDLAIHRRLFSMLRPYNKLFIYAHISGFYVHRILVLTDDMLAPSPAALLPWLILHFKQFANLEFASVPPSPTNSQHPTPNSTNHNNQRIFGCQRSEEKMLNPNKKKM
jgi:hypothetical protein